MKTYGETIITNFFMKGFSNFTLAFTVTLLLKIVVNTTCLKQRLLVFEQDVLQ